MKFVITNPANGKSVVAKPMRIDQGRDFQLTGVGNEIRTLHIWYRSHPFIRLLDSVLSEIATQVFPECPA